MYQQIKRDLLDRIARDDFEPGVPFTTQRELCDRYAVSMLTAARALTELQQEGVLVSSRGRGTFVATRRPRPSPDAWDAPPAITCIIPALTSGDVMDFVRGVERTAADYGFTTTIVDSDGSWERQRDALQRAVHSAGVVLYPVDGPGDPTSVAALRDAGVPVVFADRYWPELPGAAVLIDNYAIGYHLANRLIERGFARIGSLWVETSCTSVRDRQAGHIRAIQEHGVAIDAELLAMRDYLTQSDSARQEMLSVAVASRSTPTGFICANGFVLEQALSDAIALGLDVPGDVDFVGTDRKIGRRSTIPSLTAVTAILPMRAVGEESARIACEAARDVKIPEPNHTILAAEFQERENSPLRLQLVRESRLPTHN